MKMPLRVIPLLAACGAVAALLAGCSQSPPITLVAAPPGPDDLGPAAGLSRPPEGSAVFDLHYRAQTGGDEDLPYRSFWGFGGSDEEAKSSPFIRAVRKKASGRLHYVCNFLLEGRKWSAVECFGRKAVAVYFDLNADGELADAERLPPTRQEGDAIEFITPDFAQAVEGGGQTLCRVLLHVRFYKGASEPNTMWSPASLLEGRATVNGRVARLLLHAQGPGGAFDRYGASSYSLRWDEETDFPAGQYVPRETLSSVIASAGQFYRLSLDGHRSNGLPARVILDKDTSPTGTLAVELAASNALATSISYAYLQGVEDKTVHFRVHPAKDRVVLPAGVYSLGSGSLGYGASEAGDWELSFSQGPPVTVKAGEVTEQRLGRPTLKVHAVKENERWDRQATTGDTFKRGTTIYLEPRIIGKNGEGLTRFRQAMAGKEEKTDRPPRITITRSDGREVLSKTMEYG